MANKNPVEVLEETTKNPVAEGVKEVVKGENPAAQEVIAGVFTKMNLDKPVMIKCAVPVEYWDESTSQQQEVFYNVTAWVKRVTVARMNELFKDFTSLANEVFAIQIEDGVLEKTSDREVIKGIFESVNISAKVFNQYNEYVIQREKK